MSREKKPPKRTAVEEWRALSAKEQRGVIALLRDCEASNRYIAKGARRPNDWLRCADGWNLAARVLREMAKRR